MPQFVNITTGKVHEVNILKTLSFDPGTIVVFDRGLVDYQPGGNWTKDGIYFVTRVKNNADYEVVKSNQVPKNKNILKDQLIKLKGFYSKQKCPYYLRLVEIWNGTKRQEPVDFSSFEETNETA